MKILVTKRTTEQGTALLTSLFLCMILSVTIAGYLKHAHQQHCLSMRSQSWNTSIAVTEAGIEEGLQHLNENALNLASQGWTQSGSTYTRSRVLTTSPSGTPLTGYTVVINAPSLTAPEITSQAFITDYSLNSSGSTTTVTPSLAVANTGTITTTGSTTSSANTVHQRLVSRAVRVTAAKNGMFLKAMVAKHTIDMNGNNVMTDSFNSTIATNSNNGMYPAGMSSRLLDNGDVASNDTIKNTINIGNADIYGHVAVGPGGTIYVGTQGGVGTRSWQNGNNGVQPGYFTDDMNFTFPSVQLPYTTGLTPSSGTVSKTNFVFFGFTNTTTSATYPSIIPQGGVTTNVTYTTSSTAPSPVPYGTTTNVLTTPVKKASTYPAAGTYVGTVEVNGNNSGRTYSYDLITGRSYTYPTYTYTYKKYDFLTNSTVTTITYDYILQGGAANMPPVDYYVSSINGGNILVKGNARLVVAGDLTLGGNGSANQLTIATDGKLEMFVGGTSCKLSGNGVVNQNGYAQNLIVWCMDSVTDVVLNGNGQFTGIIVAPNGDVRLNGGGNANEDFIGSLIVNSVVMNGHFSFHYDEALKNLDGGGRYKITQWNEIPTSQSGIAYSLE